MKISLNWIKDFVSLQEPDPAEVLRRVTMSTAEVEAVERVGAHFPHVVTACIVAIKPHPNADKLKLVCVNDGLGEMEVVCGAPNLAEGRIVALAKAGCELPIGRLKAAIIRGIRSEGMICAEDELGLSDSHEGILEFPADTPIGLPLDKIFGPPDIVLEIDNKSLTHRPDLWGHIGFAREFAAIYRKPLKRHLDEKLLDDVPEDPDPLLVDNRAPDLCPRYSALVVRNVAVRPSPEWMQQRLRAVGIRPINNLVDVTNYVMAEFGQPMHAFDRRHIQGDVIVIRRADDGERFMTLDEHEHLLTPDDIMIADKNRAVALGGVMGGVNSEIVDDTTCIVLESANFHPVHIRRTANRLQLRTDSAQRFEKGQDPANTRPSIVRSVELIRLTCPEAVIGSGFLDSWPNPPEPVRITIDFDLIHRRLGERLPEETIINILRRLQFKAKRVGIDRLSVAVPTYRATGDVGIPADIVEEIGRIYGYDNITPIPPKALSDPPEANRIRRLEWELRDNLCARFGFDEVSNYSFTSESEMRRYGLDPEPCLRLKNPLSSDADRLRTSLIPNIVANVAANQRTYASFRLFELGRVTLKKNRRDPELARENFRLAGAVYGEGDTPFYPAKSVVWDLLSRMRTADLHYEIAGDPPPWANPGRCVVLSSGRTPIGFVAELHPEVADNCEIHDRVGLFDLDIDIFLSLPRSKVTFKPIRRFPVNPIEITVVVDKRRPVAEIEAVIRKAAGKLLVESRFLYSYKGEKLPADKKAVTYHVVFGAEDRTLGREEVTSLHKKLVNRLRKAGMPLRGEE